MKAKPLGKRAAEAARKALAKAYAYSPKDPYGPQMRQDWDNHSWVILWEEGPYEWPMMMHGGFDEELFHNLYPEFEPDKDKAAKRASRAGVVFPEGVYAEAINHYSAALYSKEEYL